MTTSPSGPISPLRQRMQHDMMMRGLSPRTQHQYVRNVQRFAAFLGRPPDTATAEDLRNFQIHQHECGANAGTINSTVSALRFFYTVTLRRRDLACSLVATRRPHTVRGGVLAVGRGKTADVASGLSKAANERSVSAYVCLVLTAVSASATFAS